MKRSQYFQQWQIGLFSIRGSSSFKARLEHRSPSQHRSTTSATEPPVSTAMAGNRPFPNTTSEAEHAMPPRKNNERTLPQVPVGRVQLTTCHCACLCYPATFSRFQHSVHNSSTPRNTSLAPRHLPSTFLTPFPIYLPIACAQAWHWCMLRVDGARR